MNERSHTRREFYKRVIARSKSPHRFTTWQSTIVRYTFDNSRSTRIKHNMTEVDCHVAFECSQMLLAMTKFFDLASLTLNSEYFVGKVNSKTHPMACCR